MSERTEQDWAAWHRPYDEAGSHLASRLKAVQRILREALDRAPNGPVRVISLCAGQGRDLLGVLADHPRAADVDARLVELDPRNVAVAREAASGLAATITVVEGDAGTTDACVGGVPADIVLLCGIFGNISQDDIERTIRATPSLCAAGANVLWTRHRLDPDLTPQINTWFAEAGFHQVGWEAPDDHLWAVGAHRLTGDPEVLRPGRRLFSFSTRPGASPPPTP